MKTAPPPPLKVLLGSRGTASLVDALARYLFELEQRQEQQARRRGYRP